MQTTAVPSARSHLLLVAEDLAYCEQELLPSLRATGLSIQTTTASGDELSALMELPFELVLVDIASSHGSGYRACVQVRNTSSLPLLLVLHGPPRAEVWYLYQAGADACIAAPFDPRELLARLYALLRRRPLATPLRVAHNSPK